MMKKEKKKNSAAVKKNFMESLSEMAEQKCVKLLKRIESKCKRVDIMKKNLN